jgi:hypothetical protein
MKRLQILEEEGNTEKIIKELQDNGCPDCSPTQSPIDIQNIYNMYNSVRDSNPGFFISRNSSFGIDYDIPTVWTIADFELSKHYFERKRYFYKLLTVTIEMKKQCDFKRGRNRTLYIIRIAVDHRKPGSTAGNYESRFLEFE